MAGSADEVIGFLEDLAARSRPVAARELDELSDLAGRKLAAWDVPYFAEKLKQRRFELSEEELRPYFPAPRVTDGMFELAGRLFDIHLKAVDGVSVWHDSVRYYEIRSGDGRPIGGLYTDLYARPNKRGGAWMDACLNRAALGPERQLPVAHLVCNFGAPVGDTPSLLTHSEVVTLFHEFGHTLHHLLTEIDYPSIAGINGVAWDAVELPSQFFENYAWLPEVLGRITGHYETGEPLPGEKIETMNRSRRFMAGLAMVRQLEFALFDFRLHHLGVPAEGGAVLELLDAVRRDVAVIEQPAYNRFPNSFAHIFGGGYSAGYYSYKWAEVLAADAFAAFNETSPFDAEVADRFRRSVLAVGGSKEALEAFVDFRGREPRIEPLLEQSGIAAAAEPAA
jgi:oligopeptidase A